MADAALHALVHDFDVTSLYRAHARTVWRTLLRLGVPELTIEDAVQQVFLTAFLRRQDFEGRSAALTWLLGIALGVAANARRAAAVRLLDPRHAADLPLPAPGPGADEALHQRRQLAALTRALDTLSPEQREAVVLLDLEQLTGPEVAQVLHVNLNTVYSRARLGRAALERALSAGGVR